MFHIAYIFFTYKIAEYQNYKSWFVLFTSLCTKHATNENLNVQSLTVNIYNKALMSETTAAQKAFLNQLSFEWTDHWNIEKWSI